MPSKIVERLEGLYDCRQMSGDVYDSRQPLEQPPLPLCLIREQSPDSRVEPLELSKQ